VKHWLMKTEPNLFGIADLERVKVEPWTGVRSYFARAHMRAMSAGDGVLFHHSSVDPPGVAGLARVVRTGVVDETQFDPKSPYHDPKATREAPTWDCVEVEYVETFPYFVEIGRIRAEPGLEEMLLLKRGMRLSVQPVAEAEYARIVELGHLAPPPVPAKVAKPRATAPKVAKAPKAKQAAAKPTAKAKPRATAKPKAIAKPKAKPRRR
jgi:predicted RNA-binding protein with PUA-like domain